jgi:hypothetical protein
MRVREGQRFVLTEDHLVKGLTHWRAPFTGGFDATAPAGTVVVAREQHPTAPGFYAVPEDYEKLEKILVPIEEREHGKYDGYDLVFVANEIGTWFRPLDEEAPGEGDAELTP